MMKAEKDPTATIDAIVKLFAEHLDIPVFLHANDLTAPRVDSTTTKRYLDAIMLAVNAINAAEGTPIAVAVPSAGMKAA